MNEHRKKNPKSRLGRLSPDHQEAVFSRCETLSLPEGARWIKRQFNLQISSPCLGAWLRKQRAQRAIAGDSRKTRPDSKLGMLNPGQQEEIYNHCDTVPILEALPWLKEKFNIDISATAVGRWLKKQRLDREMILRLDEIRDDRDRASLVGKAVGAATEIADANSVMLSQAVFEEFRKPVPQRDEKRLVQLMNLAIKARTVGLAFERFQFDAAQKARDHAADLLDINDGGGDEREKTEKAIRILFGVEPGRWVVNVPPAALAAATTEEGGLA